MSLWSCVRCCLCIFKTECCPPFGSPPTVLKPVTAGFILTIFLPHQANLLPGGVPVFRRFVQPGGDSGCERHNVARSSQRQHPGSDASRWWLDDNHRGAYFFIFLFYTFISPQVLAALSYSSNRAGVSALPAGQQMCGCRGTHLMTKCKLGFI